MPFGFGRLPIYISHNTLTTHNKNIVKKVNIKIFEQNPPHFCKFCHINSKEIQRLCTHVTTEDAEKA